MRQFPGPRTVVALCVLVLAVMAALPAAAAHAQGADLSVVADGPANATAGSNVTYTVTVTV